MTLRIHFCGSLPQATDLSGNCVEVPSLNSRVGTEDTVPLVRTEGQFTSCPKLSQFWSLPKSSDVPCAITEILEVLGIYLNFLFTIIFLLLLQGILCLWKARTDFPRKSCLHLYSGSLDFSSCLHSTVANPGTWIPSSRFFFLSTTAFYSHLYLSFQFKLAPCTEDQRCSGQTSFIPLWWFFWDLLSSTTLHVIRIIRKTDLKPICGYSRVLRGQVVTKPDENKLIEGYSRLCVLESEVTGVRTGGIATLRYWLHCIIPMLSLAINLPFLNMCMLTFTPDCSTSFVRITPGKRRSARITM